MNNLFDYLNQNSSKSFSSLPLNIVDFAILSQICFIDFGLQITKILPKITFKKCSTLFSKKFPINPDLINKKEVEKTFTIMSQSERYKNIKIIDYKNIINQNTEFQFCVLTLKINKKLIVIFSGTDDTLIGWKENFNMTYMSPTFSQKKATFYLNDIAKIYAEPITVIGHSKGGNLAIYSALYSNNKTQTKIEHVYAFDSPGFSKKVKDFLNQSKILDKIMHFLPKEAIIGKLFYHSKNEKIVECKAKGMWQHNIFLWETNLNDFVYAESISESSLIFEEKCKKLLTSLSTQQKIYLIETYYNLLKKSSIATYSDFTFKQNLTLILNYLKIDNETKLNIKQSFHSLLKDKSIRKIIYDTIKYKTEKIKIFNHHNN